LASRRNLWQKYQKKSTGCLDCKKPFQNRRNVAVRGWRDREILPEVSPPMPFAFHPISEKADFLLNFTRLAIFLTNCLDR